MKQLEDMGFATCHREYTDRSEWQLTESGLTELVPVVTLGEPRPLFSCARALESGKMMEEWTTFELVDHLVDSGWSFKNVLKGVRRALRWGGFAPVFETRVVSAHSLKRLVAFGNASNLPSLPGLSIQPTLRSRLLHLVTL